MEKTKAEERPSTAVISNPKMKLLDQVRRVICVKNYCLRTGPAYCD